MQGNPWVLLLVNNVEQRETVRRRLIELEVVPITVRADGATAAVERYHPIAALMDDAHAALAPEDFLESTCTHRVRLVTLPAHTLADAISDSVLRDVVSPRPEI
jgi:hypothetical protein